MFFAHLVYWSRSSLVNDGTQILIQDGDLLELGLKEKLFKLESVIDKIYTYF